MNVLWLLGGLAGQLESGSSGRKRQRQRNGESCVSPTRVSAGTRVVTAGPLTRALSSVELQPRSTAPCDWYWCQSMCEAP